MSIKWNKQTFQSLEEFWQSHGSGSHLSEDQMLLVSRYDDIMQIIESDRIWPFTSSSGRQKFVLALREVLSRLPQDDFDKVDNELGFVLEDPELEMLAVNAPAQTLLVKLSQKTDVKLGIDTVVFFRKCLELSTNALIGLIAHELAHSFVKGGNDDVVEALTDAKAKGWGFGSETDCKELEKNRLLNSSLRKA